MQVDYLNIEGKVAGQIEIPESVFAVEPHEHAIHLVVKAYLANQRQGTHKTKTRTDVSGGGKKPGKQKGRGTARSGSSRSGVWVGGGTIHGPQPHLYKLSVPKKVRTLARKSALSLRFKENSVVFIENLEFEQPKTKQVVQILHNTSVGTDKALLILQPNAVSDNKAKNVLLSARNVPTVSIQAAESLSTYDIMTHKRLVICIGAVQAIINNLQ